MKTFQDFVQAITKDDVDLIDKLDNMSGSEITGELAKFINNNNELYSKIEDFVIEHLAEYEDFIVSETEDLYEQELINEPDDYASGLYNCDEIYVRAILNAIGVLWIPERL